ncbi:hypothetical protein D3C85_1290280 [compost metagenome]
MAHDAVGVLGEGLGGRFVAAVEQLADALLDFLSGVVVFGLGVVVGELAAVHGSGVAKCWCHGVLLRA